MSPIVLGFLINLPFVIAAVATILLRRSIHNKLLFLVTCALSLLGIQSLLAPVAIGVLMPQGGGLSQIAVIDSFTRSVSLASMAQLLFGIPYIWWLRREFAKPL